MPGYSFQIHCKNGNLTAVPMGDVMEMPEGVWEVNGLVEGDNATINITHKLPSGMHVIEAQQAHNKRNYDPANFAAQEEYERVKAVLISSGMDPALAEKYASGQMKAGPIPPSPVQPGEFPEDEGPDGKWGPSKM